MRNIAIFVSGEGTAAERIVNLFNEGNRLHTVLVVASGSAAGVAARLQSKGIEIASIPDVEWLQRRPELISLLRAKDVNLIVLDDFSLPVDDSLIEAGGGKIVKVSGAELAPREVVAALEADLRKPKVEALPRHEEDIEKGKSPEQEWADALKINFTPPKVPVTPPPVPEEKMPEKEQGENSSSEYYPRGNGNIGKPSAETVNRENRDEPMPPTYLIWSVLCTVFCCFIPGIIAIIFSSQVSSRYYGGDLEGAKKASRLAEIWIIVSVVIGAVVGVLYLPFMLLGN